MRTLHIITTQYRAKVGELVTTARNGLKWADATVGDVITICTCTGHDEGHQVVGHGRIEGTWVGRFRDIPLTLVKKIHTVHGSESYDSLNAAMQRAYKDKWSENNTITVLKYMRID